MSSLSPSHIFKEKDHFHYSSLFRKYSKSEGKATQFKFDLIFFIESRSMTAICTDESKSRKDSVRPSIIGENFHYAQNTDDTSHFII